MNLIQTINRGFNLLTISIIALMGFSFASEIFLETDWGDKADDIALLAIAIIGLIWYFSKENRYRRSITPVVLVVLALLAKIAAVIVELHDAAALGDDVGAVILFVLTTIFIVYQYRKTGALLKGSSQTA